MSALMIDGVEICRLDPDTAAWLKQLAAGGPGFIRHPPMIEMPRTQCIGARPLAGGMLADRTFQTETDLTLQIRFEDIARAIQNTWL